MTINIPYLKQKIVDYISEKGPSLPVHLTKISGTNLTLTSAILSELLADKKLKLSNLRIGSSPLYLISGQEEKLEAFVYNLKEPEIQVFKKLKQNNILDDEKQDPINRVALRTIKDFAIPLKHREKLYWKYHLFPDEKAMAVISEKNEPIEAIGQERIIGQQIWEDIQKQKLFKENEEIVKKQLEEITKKIDQELTIKEVDVFEESEKPQLINISEKGLNEIQSETFKPDSIEILKKKKRRVSKKKTKESFLKDLFFKEAESYLKKQEFEIVDVIKIEIDKLIVKAKKNEELLVIFSKRKRLEEKEILGDLKKYNPSGLAVEFFILGELTKRIAEKISLFKKIKDIIKIE